VRFLGPLDSDKQAERAARDFAELVGKVINATVSHAPITMLEQLGPEGVTWIVAHCRGKRPVPMPLVDRYHLVLVHILGRRRDGQFLATLEYKYVLQASEDRDSWLLRYEYQREPPDGYPYPRSHVHVNAQPSGYRGPKPGDVPGTL
jgi:hypothetical protein